MKLVCRSMVALGALALASCGGGGSASGGASGPPPGDPGGGASPSAPSPPGPSATATAPEVGAPALQLVGRFDERDPKGPKCGWPGCRVIARFEGASRVTVRLGEVPYNDGPSEWDVAIDGAWQTPHLVLTPGVAEYALADGLSPGKHTVELYKRTEAQNGTTQLLGFDLHGGALLPPPPRAPHKLEIIGDSDVAGFGYVGALTGECAGDGWAAKYEDFHAAWGARLAEQLHAELNATVFSGKGFYQNIWRPDHETFDVLYPRSNPTDPTSAWDTTKFTPDVIVVSLGGNDYNLGQPEDFGPPPFDGFTEKVRELTGTLRSDYPRAVIVLMAYAVLTDSYPPDRKRRTNVESALQIVTKERVAAGDARVVFTAPPEAAASELTGCDGHGGPAYHARVAAFMADAIRAVTNWK